MVPETDSLYGCGQNCSYPYTFSKKFDKKHRKQAKNSGTVVE